MQCLNCEGFVFYTKKKTFLVEGAEITCDAYVCSDCDECLMDADQMNEMRRVFKESQTNNKECPL